MRIRRSHNLTQQEAKDWVSRELSELLTQFGDSVSDVSHKWDGDSMEFKFKVGRIASFKGTLKVTGNELYLNLPFPLLARGFEGTAKAEAERWLDQNLPGA